MLCRRMPRLGRPRLLALGVALAAVAVTACGEQGIQLAKSDPDYEGAELFELRCSGCHTLKAAGTNGQVGPNLDELQPDEQRVLNAIRTGPSSMPENLLQGAEAQEVARFVAGKPGR